ncbi:MAG: glutamine-hydrolyzing GMP synthase [Bacilli bacterium]|nr:glutamine-hydrolyzing GMP synthase [Bacilli bacterium]
MGKKRIVVLDFGGQYNQLIARRVRDLHVYSEVLPFNTPLEQFADEDILGFIFTGGPNSVYEASSPHIGKEIFDLGKPVLGICYGCQLTAYTLGGTVAPAEYSEYGNTALKVTGKSILFEEVPEESQVFMSHTDKVTLLPEGFVNIAKTDLTENAAFMNEEKRIYCVQYHPEVEHSIFGEKMLGNFVYKVCGAEPTWKSDSFIEERVAEIRKQVGNKKVLLGLSGGVDSSVVAALLDKAIGKQLTCVFVNHGLLRKNEAEQVKAIFTDKSRFSLNFIGVDASDLFLERLKDITEPEMKRKIIGKSFIDVFEEQKEKLSECDYLAQGTIYPDRIESGIGISATIKSHHNVGGLPKDLKFEGIVEPLKDLFKDEVRSVGLALGLPAELVYRQPFPGPGLGIRIIGEVTMEKIRMVQEADAIYREELEKANKTLGLKLSQYFAALSNMKSVGVKGDHRSYDYAIVLRAVETDDFMTARPVNLPYDLLARISDRIVNEVEGVNRVLYDFTSKPPATVELE